MQWNSAAEFFAMGGYGLYVWGSFGLTAAAVMFEIWQARAQRQAVLRSLRNQFESERSAA